MTTTVDARKDLYAFAMQGKEHSPAVSERASAKIDAYQASVLLEAAKALELRFGVTPATIELRLMSTNAQQNGAETHACSNCEGIDPDTCLMNPDRPPEQCPRSEGDGYGLQCQKPAGHNLCTFEEEATGA